MKQGPTRWLVAALLLLFTPFTFALAEEPPAGFSEDLKNIIHDAYAVTYTNRGWGSVYNLPQSQFSIDELDFFDNSAEFGETGMYTYGLQSLLNPLYSELDLNSNATRNILDTADATQPWVWTPTTVDFGTHDQGSLPNKGISKVVKNVQGIIATDATCVDATIAYNQWGLPKDTINKQTASQLSTLTGNGQIFLYAAQHEKDPTKKENDLTIAKGVGDMLLTMIVTPEGESLGIHPELLKDKRGKTIPEGMMPYQFTLKNEEDTPLCADGGTIKLNENKKGMMAQTALFLHDLSIETGNAQYEKAFQLITNGILSLQECDGTYKDYTRWEGPGVVSNTCKPDDGSEAYDPYPSNIVLGETRGFITDSAWLLYLLSKGNPELYNQNKKFKAGVISLLELEEKETGSGLARNGNIVKYASYSISTPNRPFAQLLLGTLFLRSSCQETNDSEMEKRLQKKGFALINKAAALIPSELDAKIANAIAPDVGINMFAVSSAAEAWKIATIGCKECGDADGDGYIDGTCAGNTVKYDCNDNDAAIHPGAVEVCDNVDNDCDGKVDNGFDNDNDSISTCAEPKDCNDNNNEVYPGALEKIDGIDNDCDGKKDNTGIEITLQNDLNKGIANAEIVFIDYGNACANSFAALAKSIPQIKEQCTTISACTTDANGTCLAQIKKSGKFQALANIPNEGAASLPIEFQPGQRVPMLLKADINDTALDQNANATTSTQNPFLSDPAVIAAVIILGLLGALSLGFYLVKTGNLKPIKGKEPAEKNFQKQKGEKFSIKSENKTMERNTLLAPTKTALFSGIKLPKFQFSKTENKNEPITLKVPKISATKLAEKIVSGKPIGSQWEEKMLKPLNKPSNFPPKKTGTTYAPPNKPKKIWKDE